MIYTTLNKIFIHNPCADDWSKLLRHLNKGLPDDEPVDLLTILESNGLDDALWCLCAVDDFQREIRLYAVWCARQVQNFMPDQRSLEALDVAERHANGQATDKDLAEARQEARCAAIDAARHGYKPYLPSIDAANHAAFHATRADGSIAARGAARDAARALFWAGKGGWDEIRESQSAEFRRVAGVCAAGGVK
jgi:hypothetical protein